MVGAVALGQGSGESLAQSKKPGKGEVKKEEKCEHGVKKTICTRCNPKLAPVFKAKNDWCPEHDRAESQCVICNPELAKKGVK
jgi:hypothetical protein